MTQDVSGNRTQDPAGGTVGGGTTGEVAAVTGGVDTHLDTHTAAALDQAGRTVGVEQFPASAAGYRRLLEWLSSFGPVQLVGVEGTSSYGAGLTRYLHDAGITVLEVNRPDRAGRRQQGKSDPLDAEAAAHAALAARRTATPKHTDGRVEALRMLRIARRSAVRQRADVQRQMKTLVVTAPDQVRDRLRHLPDSRLIRTCATRRPDPAAAGDPAAAALITLGALARRHQHLTAEIDDLDSLLAPLVEQINPALTKLRGVGADTAGQLLVTAGENPDRLHSEAAFAMLCGAAPLPASSGRTRRHRLNRGGDRQANAALYRVVLCQLRWDPATRAYAERRTHEGLSKKEIIRCLKRYVARDIYYTLNPGNDHQTGG